MVFEGTNGTFGRIAAMDGGGHKLEGNAVLVKIRFEALGGCFIVHEVQLRLESSGFEVVMQRLEFRLQFTASSCFKRSDQDGIAIVIVEDHQVLVPLERHGGEPARLIRVRMSCWHLEGLFDREEDGVRA